MGELLNELDALIPNPGGQPSKIKAFLRRLSPEDAADVVEFMCRGRNIPALAKRMALPPYEFKATVNSWHKWSLKARDGEFEEFRRG